MQQKYIALIQIICRMVTIYTRYNIKNIDTFFSFQVDRYYPDNIGIVSRVGSFVLLTTRKLGSLENAKQI